MDTCDIGERGACGGGLAWYGDAGRSERIRWVYNAEDFGGVCAGDDEGVCADDSVHCVGCSLVNAPADRPAADCADVSDDPGEWEERMDGDLSDMLEKLCTGMKWEIYPASLFAETIRQAPAEEADHMLRSTFGTGDWSGRFAAFFPSADWAYQQWEAMRSSETSELATVLWSFVTGRGVLVACDPNGAVSVRYSGGAQPAIEIGRCEVPRG